ncbi:hypothetical protein, partial [Staphylococcus aureus]|uniref:hypothetical protein n=1 Tax=Staphylococcus aureus TaxID=1280 RepID=UPI001C406E87
YSSTSMSTLGFIDINKAPFKVFIFSTSTLKGAFQIEPSQALFAVPLTTEAVKTTRLSTTKAT